MLSVKEAFTGALVEWLKKLYQLTLKNLISLTSDAHAPSMLAFTILSTMPNNCIFPVILCNLAPFILRLQESVASLAYAARGYLDRSIT